MVKAAELSVEFTSKGVPGVTGDINRMGGAIDNATKRGGMLGTVLGTAGGFVAANAFSAITQNVMGFASGLLNAHAGAEQTRMSLETVTGSAGRANQVFQNIQKFAKDTPFEFPELAQAAVNLESFGLKTEDWLTTIGDTGSAMGKSVDQVTQAVLDAQTGSYERLKELGIAASVEGDKVSFRYMENGKQMVKTVDRYNQEAINSTLQTIWNSKYEGAMARQASSFNGQWSTLRDNVSMQLQAMTGGVFEFAKDGLKHANMFFDRFGVGIERGMSPFQAMTRALKFSLQDAFGKDTGNQIFSVLNGIGTGVKTVSGWIGQLLTSSTANRLVSTFGKIGKQVLDIGRHFTRGGLVEGFKSIFGRNGQELLRGFGDLLGIGPKGIGDALKNITTGIKPVDRAFRELGNIWTGYGRIIQEVFQGDLRGALEVGKRLLGDVRDLGEAAFDGIREGINAINWGAVASGIGDFASGAWSAIQTGISLAWDEITALDWDNYITAIGDLGVLVAEKITSLPWGDYLGEAIDLAAKVGEKIIELPWGDYLGEAIDLASKVAEKIKELPWGDFLGEAIDLATTITGKIKDLPWGDYLGEAIDLAATIGGKITSLPWGDYLGEAIDLAATIGGRITALPWGEYLGEAIDLATTIAGKIKELPWGDYLGEAIDFGTWLWEKIKGLFPSTSVIGSTIAVFGDWLWGKIKEWFPSSATITGAISDVATWAWDKISSHFPSSSVIVGSIADVGGFVWGKISAHFPSSSVISGAIGDFGEWLWGKISGFFTNPFGGGGGSGTGTDTGAATVGGNGDGSGGFTPPVGLTNDTTPRQHMKDYGGFYANQPSNSPGTLANGELVTSLPNTGSGPGGIAPMKLPAPDVSLVEQAMTRVREIVGQGMSDALAAATPYAAAIGQVVGAQLGQMVGNAGALMTGFTNAVGQGMSNALSAASTYATAIYTVVSNQIGSLVGNVRALMGAIPGIVTSALNAAAAAAGSAGYNVGIVASASVANGIRAGLPQVYAAADELAAEVDRALSARLKIASPSRVLIERGEQSGQGFAIGLHRSLGVIRAEALGFADAVRSGAAAGPGIGASMAAAGGARVPTTQTIHYTYVLTVPPDDWVALARKVERGELLEKNVLRELQVRRNRHSIMRR